MMKRKDIRLQNKQNITFSIIGSLKMLAVYYSLSVSYIYLLKFIQFAKNYTMPNILFTARKCNITMKMKKKFE